MIFQDYESFVMLSYVMLVPFFVCIGLASFATHCLAQSGRPNIRTFNIFVQSVTVVLSLLWLIELIVGIWRTFQIIGPNTRVLPNDRVGVAVFAMVYLMPVVFGFYATYVASKARQSLKTV